MKKFLLPLVALVLTIGLQSCREDIEFTNSYEPTPVIFGLLDQADSIHYIKINKGFLGPDDALIYADIADSNYFEKVEAVVEELKNGQVERTWELKDTLLSNKDTNGVFFAPEHKVYYFSTEGSSLDPEARYRLTVNINDGQLQVVGETELAKDLAKSNNLSTQTAQFRFADDVGEYLSPSVEFSTGNTVFANATMNIIINEYFDTVIRKITIPWSIDERFETGNNYRMTAQGETFYQIVHNGLTDDPAITRRTLEGFEVVYTGGLQDLYNYIQVNQPSSTLAQTKPEFTNLSVSSGFKVIGIFSSRQTASVYKPFVNGNVAFIRCIDKKSTRELCFGEYTVDDMFCSQHPGDNSTTNPEEYRCK